MRFVVIIILLFLISPVYGVTFDITEEAIAYAHMHGHSDGNISVGIDTQDVFFIIHGFNTTEMKNAEQIGNDTLVVNVSGVWSVVWDLSFEPDGQGNYHFNVFVNDSDIEEDGCHTHRAAKRNDVGAVGGNCLITINSGDNISLRVANVDRDDDMFWQTFDMSIVLLETTERRSDKTTSIAFAIIAVGMWYLATKLDETREWFKVLFLFGGFSAAWTSAAIAVASEPSAAPGFVSLVRIGYIAFFIFILSLLIVYIRAMIQSHKGVDTKKWEQ